ncbi:hypothetical protein BDFG_05387 [Blastomyces dermatitidis ATCC 26199]|nr:hypothetical protein BDFG_05387 [Blastomyces dermatitidis ATCC 26199]
MKKLQNSADSTQQHSEQGSDRLATVSRIKLFPDSSLNDHTESYVTVLTEREGSVATAVRETGDKQDADASAGRRDNTSLQGTVTTAVAAREAGEDVTMKAVLLRLIDTAVFTFNLAFLTVMKAAAAL